MKLSEIAAWDDDKYLLDVTRWVLDNVSKNDHRIENDYFIDKEGRIGTYAGGLNLIAYNGSKLPYPLGNLNGPLSLTRSSIDSVENFPEIVPAINLALCTSLHSLVGIDKYVKDMHNPHHYGGKRYGFINLSGVPIEKGGIGLLNIKGLDEVVFDSAFVPSSKAWTIINKYLGRPDQIFDCQAELIDAGLEEFAKL